MIVINPSTRQFNIPGADMVFGVESDSGAEIKEFQVPRYVGNNLDLAGSFIRINYRNANGEVDSYLVNNVTVDGTNVAFTWELTPKATRYKGQLSFVICVTGPDTKVKWHTTLGRGQVLEGLEPDRDMIEAGTADVVAQLIALVDAQSAAVETVGENWVASVKSEGATQVAAVKSAAETAEATAVAEVEAKGVNTLATIPDDYTALQNAVDALNRTRGAAIVCEAAGSVVSVTDSSNLPMQGMKIFGRSTQDGTPTPDVPVEIKSVVEPVVRVCGKNLATIKTGYNVTVNGMTISVESDTSETKLNGTASSVFSHAVMRSEVLQPGKYTVSVSGLNIHNSDTDRLYIVNVNTDALLVNYIQDGAPKTFEIKEATVVRSDMVFSSGTTYNNRILKIQIEKGERATEYEPHSAQTLELTHTLPGIPVTSGGNYTDSDGQQWICDEIDLERGVYVRRLFFEKMTDFTKATSYTYDGVGTSCAVAIVDSVAMHTALCSHFVISHKATTTDRFNLIGKTVYFKLAGELSWEEWVARMSELAPVVIGVLDTPIETTLSETEIAAYRALHSNYPNTTVLNDAGAHMVVKYAADTKLYIDNKIKEALQ